MLTYFSTDNGQERRAILEATPAERISHMEAARARLMEQRAELQAKIDRLEAKTAALESSSSSSAPPSASQTG